jgi:hypothetical protein
VSSTPRATLWGSLCTAQRRPPVQEARTRVKMSLGARRLTLQLNIEWEGESY